MANPGTWHCAETRTLGGQHQKIEVNIPSALPD